MFISRNSLTTSIAIFAAICAMTLLIPLKGSAQDGRQAFIHSTVATVNGEVLTEGELLFTLIRMFGEDTVYDLIEDEVIVSHAEEMGVELDPNDVVEYLTNAYAPEKLAALMDAFGEDTLNHTVGIQLLALQTVTTRIDQIVEQHDLEITEDQVRDYYLDYLPRWTTPASVRFSLIETETLEAAESARQRIQSGEEFAEVCRDVSTHVGTRTYGGDIGGLVPQGYSTGERALLESTAFELDINELSEPLEIEEKWYLVMPTEKTEYEEPTLEDMHDYIHAALLDELVQPYLESWMDNLFEDVQVEITYPILVETDAASFTPGAEGSFIAPEIGTVNGRPLPEGALLFHLLRQNGSNVIKSMIEEILFVQQADEMGVSLTESELQDELSNTYEPGVLEMLEAAFGEDAIERSFYRHLVSLDVMGGKWQEIIDQQNIEITEDEVMSYYLENLDQWVRPEMVRFSMIRVASEEDAVAARERITSGESFENVCSDVSIDDNTRPYGGDIGGPLPRGFASGASSVIEEAAFTIPVGSVSQPLEVGSAGWFLIKVTDRTEAYEPTLGEMREDIYSTLLEERVSPFLVGWRSQLWEEADITVVYPIYADNPSPDFTGGPGLIQE